MHAGGYLDSRVGQKGASRLVFVLGLHGAAITALMLAPPEYVPRINWDPIDLIQIDDKAPPPPEVIPEPPRPQARTEQVEIPATVVPTGSIDTGGIPMPRANDEGTGTYVPMLPPQPLPVTIEASFVRGVEIQPDYPPSLARQDIEGSVTVRVLIGTDGRVKDVQQVSASEPEFFRATERQARRHWRFKPATRDGVAIESWRQMTVHFKMQG